MMLVQVSVAEIEGAVRQLGGRASRRFLPQPSPLPPPVPLPLRGRGKRKRLTPAAAGTGGHVMPGLAVAAVMRSRGWRVSWIGTTTGMEASLVEKHGIDFYALNFQGVRGRGLVGAVKGGEGKNYYFDAKVATILALRKHGIEAERIFASPLSINEADGILDPKGENAYLIVLGE